MSNPQDRADLAVQNPNMAGMMTPADAIAHAKARFTYRAEPKGQDRWRLAHLDADAVTGDCEDYALYLLGLIAGNNRRAVWWLLTGKAHIWFVRTIPSGGGHAVLEYAGRFSDNRKDGWMEKITDMGVLPFPKWWHQRLRGGGRRFSRFEIVAKLAMGAVSRYSRVAQP